MDLDRLGHDVMTALGTVFGQLSLANILRATFTVTVLALALQGVKFFTLAVFKDRVTEQTRLVVRKGFNYVGFAFLCLVFFDSLGANLTAILGAAGIAGVAIGFAAQSSIANVISGLFLLGEKPFAIGDVVNTGDVNGIVHSIDTLSVKIKTFDNTLVRIPHETLIKSRVVNVTRFPIRRLDFSVLVGYRENLADVLTILRKTISENRYALANPEPFVMVQQFAPSGVEIMVGVWFEKADMLALKNSIMIEILDRFRQLKVEIPFPQVTINSARETP